MSPGRTTASLAAIDEQGWLRDTAHLVGMWDPLRKCRRLHLEKSRGVLHGVSGAVAGEAYGEGAAR
ncbi:MAG: hypothetical protein ACE5HT_13655, partial [Gemmatimonadales bacterium]